MSDATVAPTKLSDYEAVIGAMQSYIDGVLAGRSDIMRPNFHPAASFFGHYDGTMLAGSAQALFDWVESERTGHRHKDAIRTGRCAGNDRARSSGDGGRLWETVARRQCAPERLLYVAEDRWQVANFAQDVSLVLIWRRRSARHPTL